MDIKLYNSLTKKIEPFTTLDPNTVKLYVCGVTPYDTSHLGHARVFTLFDTLVRFLRFSGYKVTYVQNITDIDDEIVRKAKERGVNWQALGDKWTNYLLEDFELLNIKQPTRLVKATSVIDRIINMVTQLVNQGCAYVSEGNVYYDITVNQTYGALSELTREQMLKLTDGEFSFDYTTDKRKKNPLDFLLWQQAPLDEPSWTSPWGNGRPGWHIECSAMNLEYLGNQIDIHGGGHDLLYPHHECELAQTECVTRMPPFVKYWMHIGTVMYQGEKMSKSLGNLVWVRDLVKQYSANAIRYLLLSQPYRHAWEFFSDDIEKAYKATTELKRSLAFDPDAEIPPAFREALANDFDTPAALKVLHDSDNSHARAAMWQLLGMQTK
ncbi:MAG TPA: cysteine--tRNA ligase [bacterium]|nr:cysteine--tRNA ligase [bacterium]